MDFIARPNIPSGMWEKAVQLAATRSNPMNDAISRGFQSFADIINKGISARDAEAAWQSHNKIEESQRDSRSEKDNDYKSKASYIASIAKLAESGALGPLNRPGEAVKPTPDASPNNLPGGKLSGGGDPTKVQNFNPSEIQSQSAAPGTPGSTTHQLYAAMGGKGTPPGENQSINVVDKNAQRMANHKELIRYRAESYVGRYGGKGQDQAANIASRMLHDWNSKPENIDATEEEAQGVFQRHYQIAKDAMSGKPAPKAEAPVVTPKEPKNPTLWEKAAEAVMGKGKEAKPKLSPEAAAARKKLGLP